VVTLVVPSVDSRVVRVLTLDVPGTAVVVEPDVFWLVLLVVPPGSMDVVLPVMAPPGGIGVVLPRMALPGGIGVVRPVMVPLLARLVVMAVLTFC
jgi:hypothetical protein